MPTKRDRRHIVSVSGGKDSTATAILALQRFPGQVTLVFADTGNEHEQTIEYVRDYLPQALGTPITWVRADFAEEIAARRMFIARDQRVGRKKGRRIRHSNKTKRRALAALHPTGNPYLDLCMWKGRFPARKSQFCTDFLKTRPLTEYQLSFIEDGLKVWAWQGIRWDESANRSAAKRIEHRGAGLYVYRPILEWTARQTVDFVRANGVRLNPLYSLGMNRVGCMPCINASKAEIAEISKRFPAHIDRIEAWEAAVKRTSKRGDASFFPDPDRYAHLNKRGIRSIVAWSKTSRGGRQFDIFAEDPAPVCASAYGLCE